MSAHAASPVTQRQGYASAASTKKPGRNTLTKNELQEAEPNKVGRPLSLTDEKRGIILGALAAGSSRRYAAAEAGTTAQTIANEIKRNPDFAEKIEIAEAKCYRRHLNVINAAGLEDWRASAWFLERKFRDEFGKQETIEHQGEAIITVRMVDDFFSRAPVVESAEDQTDTIDAEYEVIEDQQPDAE